MTVTGTASLDGALQLSPITGAGAPGIYVIPFLYAAGGVTDAGMEIDPYFLNGTASRTATFSAQMDWSDPLLAQVRFTIDYCPGVMTANQTSYCGAVGGIQDYGWAGYEEVAANILRVVDRDDLLTVYDSLSGEGLVAAAEAQGASARQIGTALGDAAGSAVDCAISRKRKGDGQGPGARDTCADEVLYWSSGQFGRAPVGGNDNSAAYVTTGGQTSFGANLLAGGGFLGVGFGANGAEYDIDDRWMHGTSGGGWAGVSAGWGADKGVYAFGTLGVGATMSSYGRTAWGYSLDGDFVPHGLGGEFATGLMQFALQSGVKVDLGDSARIDLFGGYQAVSTLRADFSEDDPTWGNHYLEDRVSDQFATLGFTLSGLVPIGRGDLLVPSVTIAHSGAIISDDRSIDVRSNGADAEGFGWVSEGAAPDFSQTRLGVGLKLEAASGFSWEARASGVNDSAGPTGDVNVQMNWLF